MFSSEWGAIVNQKVYIRVKIILIVVVTMTFLSPS